MLPRPSSHPVRVVIVGLLTFLASMAMAQSKKEAPPTPLEGTYWKAIELAGKPTPVQDPQREAHLQFEAGGRVSGSDGCNRISGPYQLNGEHVTFGPIAATRMACADSTGIETAFLVALEKADRLHISGSSLELFDAKGTRLAVFAAGKPSMALKQ